MKYTKISYCKSLELFNLQPKKCSYSTARFKLDTHEYCIRQNFRGCAQNTLFTGKLSWCIRPWLSYTVQQVIQGENFCDRLKNCKNRKSFPTRKFCCIRYILGSINTFLSSSQWMLASKRYMLSCMMYT